MKHYLLLLLIIFAAFSSKATHNRAGEILYKRIPPFTQVVNGATTQVYTYSITVIKYTDDGQGIADRCVDTVYFGDGSRGVAPRINGATNCGCGSSVGCGDIIVNMSGYRVKYNVYSIIHVYASPGSYVIRTYDPNRNPGVHNIPNSVNIPFYIESLVNINSIMGANSSPILSNPPTDQGIVGSCLYINGCAYDPDGDSLSYELTSCRGENGATIPLYFDPETGTNGSFSMNATTGLITWCNPQYIAPYNIAYIVKEWRKTSCNGSYLIGYVERDLQVLIVSGNNDPITLSQISDVCVKAGSALSATFTASNSGTASLTLYGETNTFGNNTVLLSPSAITSTQVGTFSWQTSCTQARKKPYDVYIVSTPGASYIKKEYRQFKVTVVPPSPLLSAPVIDTGVVTLNWSSLSNCITNLSGYNIYRKTGSNNWTANPCQQGVSSNSGFQLVGVASPTATSYTDAIWYPILNGTAAHYIVTAVTTDCVESIGDNVQSLTVVVGIKENELNDQFTIFPNPFHNRVEIDLNTNFSGEIESSIYSSDGRLVFKRLESGNKKLILEPNTLSPGVYFLHIQTPRGVVYKKLICE